MTKRRTPIRFSRAVPYALTEAQQKNFLTALASDEIRRDLETVMGVDLGTMTVQEQLEAFRVYLDSGFGIALATQVARARMDLHEAAEEMREEMSREDKIRILEAELETEKARRVRAERTIDMMDEEALAKMTETHGRRRRA